MFTGEVIILGVSFFLCLSLIFLLKSKVVSLIDNYINNIEKEELEQKNALLESTKTLESCRKDFEERKSKFDQIISRAQEEWNTFVTNKTISAKSVSQKRIEGIKMRITEDREASKRKFNDEIKQKVKSNSIAYLRDFYAFEGNKKTNAEYIESITRNVKNVLH